MPDSGTCELIDKYAAEGLSSRQIAAELGVGKSSVNRYLSSRILIPPAADWGLGPAKLVRPASKETDERVVFISDLHVPYHSVEMVTSAIKLIEAVKPHRVVINGDLPDYFQLSSFNRGLDRLDTLQDEIDQCNAIRAAVRQAAPNALIEEVEGNHCSRLRTYVQINARSLVSLNALKPHNLNCWTELDITPHGENGFLLRPEFLVKHGTFVRSEAGMSAKAEFMAAGISGTSGHTHRLAPYKKAGYSQREWWEGGSLCRLDPDYVKGGVPNWENGCLIGLFSTKTNSFAIEPVQRFNDRLLYGGKTY